MPEYMTTAEFAELVRAPIETVRYWSWKGTGPESFRLGRRRLYERQNVLDWIEQHRAIGGGRQDVRTDRGQRDDPAEAAALMWPEVDMEADHGCAHAGPKSFKDRAGRPVNVRRGLAREEAAPDEAVTS